MVSSPRSPGPPSATTQQIISLLLVIHFFCVFVALSSYTALATYMRPSALQERLRELLAPYSRTLLISPSLAPYHLTHYNPLSGSGEFDDEVYLELTVTQPDGQQQVVNLASFGSSLPEDQARFRTYAKNMAFYLSREAAGEIEFSEFARAAAGFGLQKLATDVGVLRLKRHISQVRLLEDKDPEYSDDPHDARYILTLYEADVVLADDGEVQLIKREGRGEVAPVLPAGK